MNLSTTEQAKEVIYHPKTREISGTIEILDLKDPTYAGYESPFQVTDSFGYEDWFDTYEEALAQLNIDLENHYNGSTQDGIAEENRYAAQERFAMGGE